MSNSATSPALSTSVSAGLLVLRLALGATLVAHGAQKLFEFGPAAVGASFAEMGIPMGEMVGQVTGFVEFGGGIAIIAGLATRIASLLVVGVMVGAIVFVHLQSGFFVADGGYEFVMLIGSVAAALVLTGAGPWSIDGFIRGRRAADR